jgi:signal transduction histidine kinase
VILWVALQLVRFYTSSLGDFVLVIAVLVLVNATLTILVVAAWLRNHQLQHELRAATRRRTQVEELTFAAAGLAHETKNPLGIIRGLAQQIANTNENPGEARQKARQIMEEADVTTARLGDFISYAGIRSPEFEEINALPHITDICDLIRDEFAANAVDFAEDIADVRIHTDPDMLSQIILNLLTNCLRHTAGGDRVSLSVRRERDNTASLMVSDTGCGIPAKLLPYVFKPYMGKSRGGYGLGLAIVKRIVDSSGWEINIDSTEGEGTTVRINGIAIPG